MTTDIPDSVRRGKKIAIGIACVLVVLAVPDFVALVAGPRGMGWIALVFLAPRLVFAWFIVKGYGWARAYLAVMLALNVVLMLVGSTRAYGAIGLIVALPIATIYGACAWGLWRSRALDDYCDHQERVRNPSMSMFG